MRLPRFSIPRRATAIEVSLLAVVLFCLPMFEAPKNVCGVVFLFFWISRAFCIRNLGQSSPYDIPIVGLAAVLWIAPLLSDFGNLITPLNSALRWTLLALFVLAASRLNYTRRQLILVSAALMVGGLVSVSESIWVWSSNGKLYPELRSVGHVNHSAMYTLIPIAVGIGALYQRGLWVKALGLAAIVSSLVFLLPSLSIVSGVTATIILLLGMGTWAFRHWSFRRFLLFFLVMVFIFAGLLAMPPAAGFRFEVVSRITSDNIFSDRDTILNSALAVWDQNPIFGTGWFSFGVATSEERVRAAVLASGLEYNANNYAHLPHGHNLWTTMLIERGLVGVALVTILLFLYFRSLLPLALSRNQLDPADRGVAVGALLVAVSFAVAGLGNTTMMNEHGHAGMAFIAVAYGYLRGRGIIHLNQRQSE